MKIAIVTTDGINVDDHFGKAERFLIYESKDGRVEQIGERETVPLSAGKADHPFDPERFSRIVSSIADCKRVYVTKIGDVPAKKLKAQGIEPVIYQGPIRDIKL
jgi:nitrogen fixation protein NifX